MSKVAIVTGGTSGIGKETALALKADGFTVYELSRRAEGLPGLNHIPTDITSEQMVSEAVSRVRTMRTSSCEASQPSVPIPAR